MKNMNNPIIREYSKKFVEISQSNIYEDNSARLKFATIPKKSSGAKHVVIPYDFSWSKFESLQVKVMVINTKIN